MIGLGGKRRVLNINDSNAVLESEAQNHSNAEPGDVSTALTLTLLELGNEENTPAPNSRELRFRYKYNFWSDVTKISDGIIKNSQRWENRLKEVGPKVCDVSGFCDVWSHILQSGTFTMDANVRFFREDCKPIYELPPHVDGGKFQIFFDMDFENIDYVIPLDVIKCFLCLIIHMLCGQLGYEDNIFGVTFHVRRQGIALSLWHRNSDCAEEKEFIGRQLKDLFPTASHGYIVHKDQAQKFSMKLRDNERKRKQLARKRKSEKQSLEAQALANGVPRTSAHQHYSSNSNSSKSVSPSDQQQRHSYPRNSPESATHSSTQDDSSNESESESGYSGEGSWSGGGSGSDTGTYKEKSLYNASKVFSQNNSNSINSWKNSSNRHQHSNNIVKAVEFGEFNLQESLQDSDKKPVSGIRIHSSSYPKANSHHELRDRRTSLPNIFRNGSANGTPTNSANNSNNNSPRISDANPINANQKYNSPRNSDTNQSNNSPNNTNQNSSKYNSNEPGPSATNKPWRDSASKQMAAPQNQQLHQMQQQQQQLQQKMLPQQSASKIQSSSSQQAEVVSPRGSNSGSNANNSNNSNFQRTLPLNDLKMMNRRRIQSMPTSAEKQEQLKEKYQHLDRPGASNTQSPRATPPEPFPSQPQLPTTQKAQPESQIEEPPLELIPSEQQQPIEPPHNNGNSKSNETPLVRHSFPKSIREQQLEQASPLQLPREKKKQQSSNKSKPVSPRVPNKPVSPSVTRHADVQDVAARDEEQSHQMNAISNNNATSPSEDNSNPAEIASSPVNNSNSSQGCEEFAKLNLADSVEIESGKDVNMVPSLEGALASGCGEISVDSPFYVEESPSSTANSRPQHNSSSSSNYNPGTQSPSVDANAADGELIKEVVSPCSSESKSYSKPAPLPLNATNKRKKFQNFQQPKREKREDSAVCPRMITPTNIFISVTVLVVSVSMGYLFI